MLNMSKVKRLLNIRRRGLWQLLSNPAFDVICGRPFRSIKLSKVNVFDKKRSRSKRKKDAEFDLLKVL